MSEDTSPKKMSGCLRVPIIVVVLVAIVFAVHYNAQGKALGELPL